MKTQIILPAQLAAQRFSDPLGAAPTLPPARPAAFGFNMQLKQAVQNSVAAPAAPASYVVKKGDTLSHIVRALLQDAGQPATGAAIFEGVQALARENGIKNPDLILPGQQLQVSALRPSQAAPVEPVQPPAALPPAPLPKLSAQSVIPEVELLPVPAPKMELAARAPEPLSRPAAPAPALVPHAPAEGGPVLPPQHPVRALVDKVAQEAVEKTVDLTQLIQNILHPGQRPADLTPRRENPWKRTLGAPARLTSEFGKRQDPFSGKHSFHSGIDLAVKTGTKIYAFQPGVVSFSGWKSGYGNVVVVKHESGIESVYGHNSKNLVKTGEQVTTQTELAEVGSTGRSTGPHLHFEIRKGSKAVNPVPYLAGK